jgi:hypothetical protein
MPNEGVIFSFQVFNRNLSQRLNTTTHRCTQYFVSFRSPSLFYLPVHSRCRGCLFSLDHTHTHTRVGRTPLDEGSARCRDL